MIDKIEVLKNIEDAHCASDYFIPETGVPGEAIRAGVEKAARQVGRLEGLKAFFVGLMARKVGKMTLKDGLTRFPRKKDRDARRKVVKLCVMKR